MIVGFTGTRRGMTDTQKASLKAIIARIHPTEFHHGNCVGADAESVLILELCYPMCIVIAHPAELTEWQANAKCDRRLESRGYLKRNRDIVDACEVLIAAPAEMQEQKRGGTWSTVRHARKLRKTILFAWPRELPK